MLDEDVYKVSSFQKWISLDYSAAPHILWSGRTGSGKTAAAKLLLARTVLLAKKELRPVQITVLDPKADTDFSFLDGLPRFYRGEQAPKGLQKFYEETFRKRQLDYCLTTSEKGCG